MKIAIASDDRRAISSHFGRTGGFVIYEVEDDVIKGSEYRPNIFTGPAHSLENVRHDYDRRRAVLVALSGCEAVISHGMGARMHDCLMKAGIQSIITEETLVETALNMFITGELQNHSGQICTH